MRVITETLRHQQHASSFLLDGQLNIPKLKGAARVQIHPMAWAATRGISNALAIIEENPDFEPTDDELADRVHPGSGWREVVEWAAYLTLKNRLEADLNAEIALLQTSMTFAAITGRRAVGLIPIRAGENLPASNDFTIIVQRNDHPEAVCLDLEYNACPADPEGLHFIGCGCAA